MLTASSASVIAAPDLYTAAGIQPAKRKALAPSFTLRTMGGATLESDALRGKVIVLNFWATWCGPCKDEMPAMQRLQESFPAADLALLAVTTDQQQDAIATFAKGLGLSFPILLDDTKEVSAAFGVRGLPTTVIIDRQGHLAGH
ncbi:MAG TPA: TlpA disulfide reductase family protein, partial [Nitrospiraceae bacterium]|nr:TlpA disulfide reductase family protein [Nitrospiraceae bacterium]